MVQKSKDNFLSRCLSLSLTTLVACAGSSSTPSSLPNPQAVAPAAATPAPTPAPTPAANAPTLGFKSCFDENDKRMVQASGQSICIHKLITTTSSLVAFGDGQLVPQLNPVLWGAGRTEVGIKAYDRVRIVNTSGRMGKYQAITDRSVRLGSFNLIPISQFNSCSTNDLKFDLYGKEIGTESQLNSGLAVMVRDDSASSSLGTDTIRVNSKDEAVRINSPGRLYVGLMLEQLDQSEGYCFRSSSSTQIIRFRCETTRDQVIECPDEILF